MRSCISKESFCQLSPLIKITPLLHDTIIILSRNEELESNLVEIPIACLDATGLLLERCSAQHLSDRSSVTQSPGAASMFTSLIPGATGTPHMAVTTVLPVSNERQIRGSGTLLSVANLSAGLWGCSL